jgi:hypothetical protein
MAVDGSYSFDPATEKDSRSRRRRIAEQLMAQGMETTPIQSPWQGAARMAQALMGGIELGMEDKKEREQLAAQTAHNASIAKDIFGGGAPASPVASALGGKPIGGPITLGGFEPTVARTLEFEGGLNPRDTNGTPSNFGINAKANPDVDVMNLTPQGATEIYRKRYWDAIGADKLDPRTAHVAFDTAVIAGPGKAKELLAASGGDPEKFLALREQFQNRLLAANPEKYGPYAKAWANRTATLRSDVGAQPGGMMAFGGQPGPAGPIQVAQAGGQTMNDGNARVQQLYGIATNPMTSPVNKKLALDEIERLRKGSDPAAALDRENKSLQNQKLRNELNTPPPTPLTPEERQQLGIRPDIPAYRQGKEIKFGPAGTSITNTMNTADGSDKKFFEKFDEKSATRWDKYFDQGDKAQRMMGDLNQLREISKVVGSQGAGVNVKAALGPYAEALGIDIGNLSDIQTFESIVQRLAPQLREEGSGSTSDIEFKGFLRSIGPLANNPQARERIIDTFEAFARHDMARAEIASKLRAREITLPQAEKEIRALPDPLTAFRQFKKDNPDAFKGGAPAPATAAPGQKIRRYNEKTGRFEEVTQ